MYMLHLHIMFANMLSYAFKFGRLVFKMTVSSWLEFVTINYDDFIEWSICFISFCGLNQRNERMNQRINK